MANGLGSQRVITQKKTLFLFNLKGGEMKERYRIEDIQKATVNGKAVKIFSVYEYDSNSNAYIFCGKFSAPIKTANKNLVNFIDED